MYDRFLKNTRLQVHANCSIVVHTGILSSPHSSCGLAPQPKLGMNGSLRQNAQTCRSFLLQLIRNTSLWHRLWTSHGLVEMNVRTRVGHRERPVTCVVREPDNNADAGTPHHHIRQVCQEAAPQRVRSFSSFMNKLHLESFDTLPVHQCLFIFRMSFTKCIRLNLNCCSPQTAHSDLPARI
jgi:hypothetical protein